jgi:hypothetical protein
VSYHFCMGLAELLRHIQTIKSVDVFSDCLFSFWVSCMVLQEPSLSQRSRCLDQ